MQLFPRGEKRETRSACDTWNDQWKTQHRIIDGLTKWLCVGRVTEALKATRDRNAWKVIIAYSKEQENLID